MTAHFKARRYLASDNYASVHPDVLAAIIDADGGHARPYGADDRTVQLRDVVQATFGEHAEVFPTLTGTGSNVVALQAATKRHESVICARTSHVNVDEGGAPERSGLKLLPVTTPDGRLTPELVDTEAWGYGDQHRSQPGVVSITQSTELGTVYRPDEIRALADHAHGKGMRLHLDGARLANAAAALGMPLRAVTTDVGVDIVSFGGTKNGAMLAEAVVVLNPALARDVSYLRKGFAQLGSKTRYVSAQLVALLTDDLWRRNADAANSQARRLASLLEERAGLQATFPVDANAVFVNLPTTVASELASRHGFYVWDEPSGLVRFMCSWDTQDGDVDALVASVTDALSTSR